MGHDQPRFVTDRGQDPDEGASLEELMGGFRRARDGATARFGAAQAAIIRDLIGQVIELLGESSDPGGEAEGGTGPGAAGGAGRPGGQGGRGGAGGAAVGEPPSEGLPVDGPVDADDLAAMVGLTENAKLSDDPMLARLLPDAYEGNPEAADEFRRYTEQGLRSGKVAAARAVLATLPPGGGRVRLAEPEAQAWLRALNDVRLMLGVALEVTDDFDDQVSDMSPDDPRAPYVGVYQWLAYIQDTLVRSLS
jgi:hypothetical protein